MQPFDHSAFGNHVAPVLPMPAFGNHVAPVLPMLPDGRGPPTSRPTASPAREQPAMQLPANWEQRPLPAPDADGRTFYFVDHATRTTHWELPAPEYSPPTEARQLFDIHVPPGVAPGGTVSANGFHVRVPMDKGPGMQIRAEFVPTTVTVPAGFCAGMTVAVEINGLQGHVPVPRGFKPGQQFVVMAPAPFTEAGHAMQPQKPAGAGDWSAVHSRYLPPNWAELHDTTGKPFYQNSQTRTTQWEVPTPEPMHAPMHAPAMHAPAMHAPTPAPAPAAPPSLPATSETYVHVAPDGKREQFSGVDNAAISRSRAAQPNGGAVRISDVHVPNGTILGFEVRWGSRATSQKMPNPPSSGMIQVNVGNQNTRVVEVVPGTAALMHAPSPMHAPPMHAPPMHAPPMHAPPMHAPMHTPIPAPAPISGEELRRLQAKHLQDAARAEATAQANAASQAQMAGITDPQEIKKLQVRNRVITELMTTERAYCKSLVMVEEFYYAPLKAQKGTLEVAYAPFAAETAPDHFSAQPIANVMTKFAPYLRMYRPFVSNYKQMLATITRLETDNEAFRTFMAKQQQSCASDLQFLVIKPVQRIPRYALLVGELVKHTPSSLNDGLDALVRLHAGETRPIARGFAPEVLIHFKVRGPGPERITVDRWTTCAIPYCSSASR
jgi:hypothetical protein